MIHTIEQEATGDEILAIIEKRKKKHGYCPLCMKCKEACKIVNAQELDFICFEYKKA